MGKDGIRTSSSGPTYTEGQKTLPCTRDTAVILLRFGFPGGSAAKNLPANARDIGDPGSIPGLGGSPGGGPGFPPQCSCLENPMDRDYSPWGHKTTDMTDRLTLSLHKLCFSPEILPKNTTVQ